MFSVKEKPVAKTGEFLDRTVSFDRKEIEVLFVSQKTPPTTWIGLKVPGRERPVILDGGLVSDLFKKKGNAYEIGTKITIGCEKGKIVF